MDISDMSSAAAAKSDQLNAVDLIGGSKTILITAVSISDALDQPVSIFYSDDCGKPFKPCKTMIRVMMHAYGKNGNDWTGKRLELYCDDAVRWAGKAHGGVRIKNMSHIKSALSLMLPMTRGKKAMHSIGVLHESSVKSGNSKLDAYKSALDEASKNGILALVDAWKLIPRNAQSSMELYKDKCKRAAAASDERLRASSMSAPVEPGKTQSAPAAPHEPGAAKSSVEDF